MNIYLLLNLIQIIINFFFNNFYILLNNFFNIKVKDLFKYYLILNYLFKKIF